MQPLQLDNQTEMQCNIHSFSHQWQGHYFDSRYFEPRQYGMSHETDAVASSFFGHPYTYSSLPILCFVRSLKDPNEEDLAPKQART